MPGKGEKARSSKSKTELDTNHSIFFLSPLQIFIHILPCLNSALCLVNWYDSVAKCLKSTSHKSGIQLNEFKF